MPKAFEAEIWSVQPPNFPKSPQVIVHYRKSDGSSGSVYLRREDYNDDAYWPPAKGDIIRVQLQSVGIVARPRKTGEKS